MKAVFPLLLLLSLFAAPALCAPAAVTPETTAEQLLQAGMDRMATKTAAVDVRFEKHRKELVTVVRIKTRISRREPGVIKTWVLQLEPEMLAGVQFLFVGREEGGDSLWHYMPVVGKANALPANAGGNPPMFGTHYRLEDLDVTRVEKGEHSRLGEDTVNVGGVEHRVYIVETRLKGAGPYRRVVRFLDAEQLLPLRIDYFDVRDRPVRRFAVLGVAKVGEVPVATHTRMEKLGVDGEYTDMFLESYRFDLDEAALPERTFTPAYLEEVGEAYK